VTGPGDRNGDAATPPGRPTGRRSLRAVLSGDLAGFSGQVSVNETGTLLAMREVRQIAMAQLDKHNGWLFGMPGDGLFALFESAVDAVQCALELQSVFAQTPILDEMRMRIGVHMGEVLFDNDLPFGETLTIAARLEALAEPGTILISAPVFDAVAARMNAAFEPRGTPRLKNIPRRISTYAVRTLSTQAAAGDIRGASQLDQTMQLDRRLLRRIRDGEWPVETEDQSSAATKAKPAVVDTRSEREDVDDGHDAVDERAAAQSGETGAQAGGYDAGTPSGSAEAAPAVPTGAEPTPAAPVGAEPTDARSDGLAEDLRDELADMLAFYVGPMARVLVERYASGGATVDELVNRLAAEIPNEDERMTFRLRAAQVYLNRGGS
jgi:class 3 adenylate cyclase